MRRTKGRAFWGQAANNASNRLRWVLSVVMRNRFLTGPRYPWVVVALCVMVSMALSFVNMGFGALFPFIQKELEINLAQLGLIASGLAGGAGASALPGGWLADVMGVRRLQTVAIIGVFVGVVSFSQTQSLVQAVLLAVLIGMGLSPTAISYSKAILDWVPPRMRGLAAGIVESSASVGGIIAAVLITFLAVTLGWRSAVMILSIMIAASGIGFFSLYRDIPRGSGTERDRSASGRSRLSLVARDRDMILLSLFGTAFSAIQAILTTYLVLFSREDLKMSAGLAGGVLAVYMAGGAVGRLGWGLASDLMRRRRLGVLALVGVFSAVFIGFIAVLRSDTPLAVVLVVVFLTGSATLGRSAVYVVVVGERAAPALLGTALGYMNAVSRVGSFGLPPIFGLIVDRTRSYHLAWWMMAGVAAFGSMLLAFVRPQGQYRSSWPED